MLLLIFISLTVRVIYACFCPQIISPSCGCGGNVNYNPSYNYAQYNGGGYGGYSQQTDGSYPGSYAVFYRDLTPFRQSYYNAVPSQQSFYHQPIIKRPLYEPNIIRPQQPQQPYTQKSRQLVVPSQSDIQPASEIIKTEPVLFSQFPQAEIITTKIVEKPVFNEKPFYPQPSAAVAPLVEKRTQIMHDGEFGNERTIFVATTSAPNIKIDEPDFVDEIPDNKETLTEEKEETYYVYYDDQGNKVGDSRSGSTFAPQDIIETVTETIEKVNTPDSQSYDDVVEELTTKLTIIQPTTTTTTTTTTTAAATGNNDLFYEDETVEYEDEKTSRKKNDNLINKVDKKSSDKVELDDNQILVDAADNIGETIGSYKQRAASAKGVKILRKETNINKQLHSN